MTTNLGALLGIDLPLIQAPMAGVQGSALAIAVSNAGALGSLPAAMLTPQVLHCRTADSALRHAPRPFNVNFFCHTPPVPDVTREAAWRVTRWPRSTPKPGWITRWFPPARGACLSPRRRPICLKHSVPPWSAFISGLPAPALVQRVKAWGARVLSSATTVEEALWLEAHGADAIIAQGLEAGGHRGMFLTDDLTTQMGTLALLPQILRAVNVPVIAAGGITDAAGVAAAMALGASGVQVGTAYLLCTEATTSAVHRAALQSDASRHTALTNVFTGRPARGIVNRVMRELGVMSAAAPAFPLATAAMAPLRAWGEQQGMGDFSPLWSGQNASGCRPVDAAEVTQALAQGFAARPG
jgi:nitronate monooxygenase